MRKIVFALVAVALSANLELGETYLLDEINKMEKQCKKREMVI